MSATPPPEQPALPGLELGASSAAPMLAAARLTIAGLWPEGPPASKALLCQLALSLSEAIDGGRRAGRASAVALAARELRETMLVLDPPPEDAGAGADAAAALREFYATLERYANSAGGGG